jgi:hypothetical protein
MAGGVQAKRTGHLVTLSSLALTGRLAGRMGQV